MIKETEIKELGDKIIKAICTIYDPEIPVNIYELGLIYDVENIVKEIDTIENVKVNIVFEPPWTKDMMGEEAKLELGML